VTISKTGLAALVRAVSKDAVFYGPVRRGARIGLEPVCVDEKGVYRPGAGGSAAASNESAEAVELCYDYVNTSSPSKGALFPQCEVLLRYGSDGNAEEPCGDPRETVLFGVRPCDARSFALLDRIFGTGMGGRADPYYLSRRDATTVISMACDRASATCFCGSVGGGPHDRTGSDVIVFDRGDDLVFETCTERGERFLSRHAGLFGAASRAAKDEPASPRAVSPLIGTMDRSDFAELKRRLDTNFDHPLWERLSATCLGCGACVYMCPTCHCFDVTDETNGSGAGVRIRTWDSCQYPLFTRHASGHNPRDNKRQRVRQRLMHKFSYTLENVGEIFCVGCGRCIQACPVNIDIREALHALRQLAVAG